MNMHYRFLIESFIHFHLLCSFHSFLSWTARRHKNTTRDVKLNILPVQQWMWIENDRNVERLFRVSEDARQWHRWFQGAYREWRTCDIASRASFEICVPRICTYTHYVCMYVCVCTYACVFVRT